MNIYDHKYQIFISSTYLDLKETREETIRVILSLFQIPIGMEMFNADNEEQWLTIQKTIDDTDYYLLIIGHRYGSLTKEGISFTEKEFDYAKANKIPILAFIRERNISTKPEERDTKVELQTKLEEFIKKVEGNAMVDFWTDKHELGKKVSLALTKQFHKGNRIGWVRANQAASPRTLEELTFLSKENRELKEALESLRSAQKSLVPDLKVKINNSDKLTLEFKTNLKSHKRIKLISRENYLPIISAMANKTSTTAYNDAIAQHKDIVEKYNEKVDRIERVNSTIPLSISVNNIGMVKAKEIFVDVSFPSSFLLYEKSSFKKRHYPIRPKAIPENPIDAALGRLGGVSVESSLGIESVVQFVPNFKQEYWSQVEDQKLTVSLTQLLHTRKKVFDDFLIVPLEPGSFTCSVQIICEEYLKPVVLDFPIEVKSV